MAQNPFSKLINGGSLPAASNPFANLLQMGIEETLGAGAQRRVPAGAKARGQDPETPKTASLQPAPQASDLEPPGGVTGDMDRYRRAIRTIESGSPQGNYGLVVDSGKGDKVLGAYQVRETNLPSWSREVLGREVTREEFLKNPQLQDQIFDAKFGQALKQHGNPDDAASVWFSGRPQKQAGNASDRFGTTVPDYIRKFRTGVAQAGAPAQLSPEGMIEGPKSPSGRHFPQQMVPAKGPISSSSAPVSPNIEDRRSEAPMDWLSQGGQDARAPLTAEDGQNFPELSRAAGIADVGLSDLPRATFAERVQIDPAENINTLVASAPQAWQAWVAERYQTDPLAPPPEELLPRDVESLAKRFAITLGFGDQ